MMDYDEMANTFEEHARDSAYNAHYDRPAVLALVGDPRRAAPRAHDARTVAGGLGEAPPRARLHRPAPREARWRFGRPARLTSSA